MKQHADDTSDDQFHHPGYEPVGADDADRVRAAVDTTSVDGTDTEFAPAAGKEEVPTAE